MGIRRADSYRGIPARRAGHGPEGAGFRCPNLLGLIVADWAFSGFSIEHWGPLLFAGAVLGVANAFLKPLLTFIALPLILLTFGIAYFFVNVAMLLFTEWVVPNFSIDGFWTYVGATIVLWLVNWLVSQLVWSVADNRP